MSKTDRMLGDIRAEVEMTRHLIGKERLADRVLDAMKEVPRHKFVPATVKSLAYCNGPVPIGCGQTISQPYIVALMTDLLNPQPDDTILEIGTGSAYQAAVLAILVKQVYSVEIVDQLATQASTRLQKLGYNNVAVKAGDGYCGWPEHAPYDGIIVTAATPNIPSPLVAQLKIGGRLVIPIGLPYQHQELMMIEKTGDDEIVSHDILGVIFVPLTGDHGQSTKDDQS